jgi:hypothetical protein
MSGLRWAVIPMVAGVLTAHAPLAAANEPAVTPEPAPAPTAEPSAPEPESTPTATPEESPAVVAGDTAAANYVTTVTTTTTTVNAPIIVVAAPITTTNTTMLPGPTGANLPVRERLVLYLNGCGRAGRGARLAQQAPVRLAHVRLAQDASLVVRVNGRSVATLRLPQSPRPNARGVALQLRLARDGMLTIRRPSGRVLAVQGCTPA